MTAPSACSGCGAPIRWARSAAGVRAPYDFAPDPKGLWAIDERGVSFYVPRDAKPRPTETFTSHFATCPKARAFKKEKTS